MGLILNVLSSSCSNHARVFCLYSCWKESVSMLDLRSAITAGWPSLRIKCWRNTIAKSRHCRWAWQIPLPYNNAPHAYQKACFNLFPELKQFAMSHVAGIDRKHSLMKYLKPLRWVYSCHCCSLYLIVVFSYWSLVWLLKVVNILSTIYMVHLVVILIWRWF